MESSGKQKFFTGEKLRRIVQRSLHLPSTGLDLNSLFGSDFKLECSPVEADLKLHKEVGLSQDQRHIISAHPGKGKPHRRVIGDLGRCKKRHRLLAGYSASQPQHSFGVIPDPAQLNACLIGQHVHGRSAVDQTDNVEYMAVLPKAKRQPR